MEILLGPILLIKDVAMPNKVWGGILVAVCLICFLLPIFVKKFWVKVVAGISILLWIFAGFFASFIQV
jgi:hypothetical protein